MWENYKYTVPEKRKIRYIVHTDCKNEADDQYTLAHALMTEKFDVCGIIAGHFCKAHYGRFHEKKTANASYDEVLKVLNCMGLDEKYPVFLGANEALSDINTPIVTEAAQFIINEAMRDDSRPLYIGMQGAITDLACAILMEPKICERMTCIWTGGSDYPNGGAEFNLMNDIKAANVVFSSNMPLWQIPKSVYKQFAVSLAELQLKVLPCGDIGKYLFEQLTDFNNNMLLFNDWPHGEIWTLGDEGCVCSLLEETERTDGYTMIAAPIINDDMTYSPCSENRPIRVYHKMDIRLDLEDLFAKLQINYLSK